MMAEHTPAVMVWAVVAKPRFVGPVTTLRGSQLLAARVLLTSPLYVAFQLHDPGVENVWPGESGTTPFVTGTAGNVIWLLTPFVMMTLHVEVLFKR